MTQWMHNDFKLNETARCSKSKTFSSETQEKSLELTIRDMLCRKTEAQQTSDIDDGDTPRHPTLVLSYQQAFDTADTKIGAEREPQKTEIICYVGDVDAAPPEWSINDVRPFALSNCVRTLKQNFPFSASLGVSRINHILRVHGHTVLQERQAAKIFDEVGQGKFERLFPGFTEDGLEQATLSNQVLGTRGRGTLPAQHTSEHSLQPNRGFWSGFKMQQQLGSYRSNRCWRVWTFFLKQPPPSTSKHAMLRRQPQLGCICKGSPSCKPVMAANSARTKWPYESEQSGSTG